MWWELCKERGIEKANQDQLSQLWTSPTGQRTLKDVVGKFLDMYRYSTQHHLNYTSVSINRITVTSTARTDPHYIIFPSRDPVNCCLSGVRRRRGRAGRCRTRTRSCTTTWRCRRSATSTCTVPTPPPTQILRSPSSSGRRIIENWGLLILLAEAQVSFFKYHSLQTLLIVIF